MAAITSNLSSLSPLAAPPSSPKQNPMLHHGRPQLRSTRTSPPSLTLHAVRPSPQLSNPPQHPVEYHDVRGEEEEEEMQRLISVIRSELAAAAAVATSIDGDRRLGADAASITENLQLVDLIQRLGISRFFEPQIRMILNTTFRRWDEKRGLGDGDSTVLAFRLLRLDGFDVSPDVIENLKDESGEFSSFSFGTPEKLSGMINLYKCSQTGFPSESKIMGEAKDFSVNQLRRALSEGAPSVLQHDNLEKEVKFALEYPRRFLLWRLESRSIIKRLWPSTGIKNKCLHLARIDLEMLQKIHRKEADELKKWWVDAGVPEFEFARVDAAKAYFSFSVSVFEPQFTAFRAELTKSGCIAALVDDLFDFPSNSEIDGFARFVEAFQRWDASLLDDLPQHKAVLTIMQRSLSAQSADSSEAQGRDLFPFFKALWDNALPAFLKEAEWRINKHVPGWNEYIQVAKITVSGIVSVWTTIFLLGELITDDMIKYIGKDSRFMDLVLLVARLSNDLVTFEREERDGELSSSVGCYLKDNPDSSKEEAIAAMHALIESACQELELELFMSRGKVPECCSRVLLNFARTMAFIYKRVDAFHVVSDSEYEDLVKDYIFGSFQPSQHLSTPT